MPLVITRRVGEMFYVGDDVQVRVLAISGSQVRIGITAPEDVEIYREEIYLKIQDGKVKVNDSFDSPKGVIKKKFIGRKINDNFNK